MAGRVKIILSIVALAVLIILCQEGSTALKKGILQKRTAAEAAAAAESGRRIVLDPGHGGVDGGKIGVNGAKEKEINLKIALKIKELLTKENIDVIMTRETEARIGEDQVSDLKARVAVMNEQKPVLAVSIHQNSYHEESVHGAQVFYHTNSSEGERAAGILQESLRGIDPENTKQAKANNTYYILKKTEVPTIIAECGFLSNYEEAERLVTEEYQDKLAEAVTEGILQYIEDVEKRAGDYPEEKAEEKAG